MSLLAPQEDVYFLLINMCPSNSEKSFLQMNVFKIRDSIDLCCSSCVMGLETVSLKKLPKPICEMVKQADPRGLASTAVPVRKTVTGGGLALFETMAPTLPTLGSSCSHQAGGSWYQPAKRSGTKKLFLQPSAKLTWGRNFKSSWFLLSLTICFHLFCCILLPLSIIVILCVCPLILPVLFENVTVKGDSLQTKFT